MSTRRALSPAEDISPAPGHIPVARPYLPPSDAITPYLRDIDQRRWYSNFGPLLTEFEARLAARFNPGAAVTTVANGTQGLALTLTALGLPSGALVAMPAWTFVATAHAVLQAGLVPWFLDVDPHTWALTPQIVLDALPRAPGPVAAVIAVSPFGSPLDADPWVDLREQTGLAVLIDAAAAFDTVHDAALPTIVSLHATKVLGVGEGGMVASTDRQLIERLRQISCYGFKGARESMMAATNAKLSEYAAAVGMASLDMWPTTRMRYGLVAQGLRIALSGLDAVQFQPGWGTAWVTSVCVARLPDGSSDRIQKRLSAVGIDTRCWWGRGCQDHPAFAGLPHADLAATRRLAASTIGLPYAMDMDGRVIGRIAQAVIEAVRAG